MQLSGKTIFITGASRGIGKAIALRLAQGGANIVIAAKSTQEDPRLGGTIYSAAKEVEEAGGKALPVVCDIRDEEQILRAVQEAITIFGGIDTVINNASAITLGNTSQMEAKRMDLMYQINVRGTFLVTKHCVPFLRKSENPHILTLSPPLNMSPKWFANHAVYTLSKYNMSMLAMGWAAEYAKHHIASNTLWPATLIATAAVQNLLGGDELVKRSRKPQIMADAAYHILKQSSKQCSGNFFVDEEVLRDTGVNDFSEYDAHPGNTLQRDLFLD